MTPIQFIDLAAQQKSIRPKIKEAIDAVLAHGKYIMGPEVTAFEAELCKFCGAQFAVSCSNGTDAITMPLMAWDIGPGDAVFCPSFTFASTGEVVALVGANPVFVDVAEDTFNMDCDNLELAIAQTMLDGKLKPKAIIAVDLFGQMADYSKLRAIADKHGLKLISDAAQGFGATNNGAHSIKWADAVTTSFFPAKPLGCYGDGGAVLTNDADLKSILQSIRVHGKGSDKYDNVRIGLNARLDTIQAAILMEKISVFAEEIEKRNAVADRYSEGLLDVVKTPYVPSGYISTWAQYTLQIDDREAVASALKEKGVPTAVYYPKPLHQQTAYKNFASTNNRLPVSDKLAQTVLSLPMHPYLESDQQDYIISSVLDVCKQS